MTLRKALRVVGLIATSTPKEQPKPVVFLESG